MREKHTGKLSIQPLSVRQTADGPVVRLRVVFLTGGGQIMVQVGEADVSIRQGAEQRQMEVGPITMDLEKIDLRSLLAGQAH